VSLGRGLNIRRRVTTVTRRLIISGWIDQLPTGDRQTDVHGRSLLQAVGWWGGLGNLPQRSDSAVFDRWKDGCRTTHVNGILFQVRTTSPADQMNPEL